jgi:capsular exopolysaccharide synthesis family protein
VDLNAYLVTLWRRKWIILATFLVTVTVAALGVLRETPTYEASATLRAALVAEDVGYEEVLYADRLMNTFPAIIESAPMRAELKERLGTERTPRVDVRFPAESELMRIVVKDPDPELVAKAANTTAELFLQYVSGSSSDRNLDITMIDPATTPRSPSSSRSRFYFPFAAVIGLAGGAGLAFLFENLDTTLYSVAQITEASGVDVLARVPQVTEGEPVVFPEARSPLGEAFRRLQTNLLTPYREQSPRTLMVTSTEPGEGKSTVVANLAQVLAQSGRKVLVVDSNLRDPTLHQLFDVSSSVGLSNVVKEGVRSAAAVQATNIPGLYVLASGPLPGNPTDLLTSPQMPELITELGGQYDAVLWDTPALGPVIDAATIAPSVEGTLLVVQRAMVRREDLQAVLDQLRLSRANLVGVVVNRTKDRARPGYQVQD